MHHGSMGDDHAMVGPPGCGAEQVGRWAEVLDHLQTAVADRTSVVVDGNDELTTWVADRLAERLLGVGRACIRLPHYASRSEPRTIGDTLATNAVTVADGSHWRRSPYEAGWDVVIWLRTPPAEGPEAGYRGDDADIVIDLHDATWPVIRHIATRL